MVKQINYDGASLIHTFVSVCLPFRERLIKQIDYWLYDDGTISSHAIMSQLSYFLTDYLQPKNWHDSEVWSNAEKIFNKAEELLQFGNEEVKNAIATCLLESLSNVASHGSLDPLTFVSLLGPLSKDCIRNWENFMGGPKTLGI